MVELELDRCLARTIESQKDVTLAYVRNGLCQAPDHTMGVYTFTTPLAALMMFSSWARCLSSS